MLRKSRLGISLWILAFALSFLPALPAQAQQSADSSMTGTLKAFVLTSTYGVLAGSLTGLASLAFYKTASAHTRNIAVGASLGLYTGIFLGAYIVYGPMLASPPEGTKEKEENKVNPDDPINLGADIIRPQGPRFTPTLSYLPETGVQLGVLYSF